jgi:hypothetical protein
MVARGDDDGEKSWPGSTEMHVKLRVFCSAWMHACMRAAWRPFVRAREAQADEARMGDVCFFVLV